MSLSPVEGRAGLWKSDAWNDGEPGLFALVIGVSSYKHLDGGPDPAPTTYGLGQLQVSAVTAYRFQQWLGRDYKRPKTPLALCWMLLSPTTRELAAEPALATNPLTPTFENCEKAIGEWFAAMSRLPASAAADSRSLFLFSGHGLEMFEDKQILLPADYLCPPLCSVNKAVSTLNLSRGLKALKVPRHFFFLDACRNDHDSLTNVSTVEGTQILNELKNSLNNPDCLVPLFYASAAGQQAFQPTDPKNTTLFARALLEGLRAHGLKPECKDGTCVIDLNKLEPFVRDRLVAIMRDEYHATSFQKVRLRGDHVDDPLTEVPRPVQLEPVELPDADQILESVRSIRFDAPDIARGFDRAHHVFGSEYMTGMWTTGARLFDVQRRQWRLSGDAFVIEQVTRDPEVRSSRITFRIQDAVPQRLYWIELSDGGRRFGCFVMEDLPGSVLFRVDLETEVNVENHERRLTRFDVSYSEQNSSRAGQAARMWDEYEQESATAAANAMPDLVADALEGFLREKKAHPVSAAVAGLILLRARRYEKLHDWLRNLANWYPEISDGPVLWAQQCMDQPGSRQAAIDVLPYVLRLEKGPLPIFGESFSFAARQVRAFLALDDLSPAERASLQAIQSRLDETLRWYRTGGLFATFAGPSNAGIGPEAWLRA